MPLKKKKRKKEKAGRKRSRKSHGKKTPGRLLRLSFMASKPTLISEKPHQ